MFGRMSKYFNFKTVATKTLYLQQIKLIPCVIDVKSFVYFNDMKNNVEENMKNITR